MKISAIICEYNPMHAGHIYHIEETKRLTGCDKVICIMSGSFTQRAEPAIFDKFSRAKAALMGGADLIIELPTLFSCASAEKFAFGGVYIATSLGIVDFLSFGCECGDIDILDKISSCLIDEPYEFKLKLRQALKSANSYPAARAHALASIIEGADEIISTPNNILAIEYLKALKKLNSKISAVPIIRNGSGYLDAKLSAVPSALAVRNAVFSGTSLFDILPKEIASCYTSSPVNPSSLFLPAMIKLRSMSAEELNEIDLIDEGLNFKLKSASKTAKSYDELISLTKSKRYTETRIRRIILNTIFDIKKSSASVPSYIRILGVKKESKNLLSMINEHALLPVIISPLSIDDGELRRDIVACDIRALLEFPAGIAARDYTNGLIVV